MAICKFCSSSEGMLGPKGKPLHINNQGLCGPCATLLNKARYMFNEMLDADKKLFVDTCEFNESHNLYVPRSYYDMLDRLGQVWTCKQCGRAYSRDYRHLHLCKECAKELYPANVESSKPKASMLVLPRCDFCGKFDVIAHAKHRDRCEACGKRYIKYMNSKAPSRMRASARQQALQQDRIQKLEQEYVALMRKGYKVPKSIIDKYGCK